MTASTGQLVRLNKLLASKIIGGGVMSRREADAYIAAGWVRVDGVKVDTVGTKVAETADVDLIAEARDHMRTHRKTCILHKPLGFVSCQPDKPEHVPAVKLLTNNNMFGNYPKESAQIYKVEPCRLHKLAVAGRLDVNSTGLLLFTQCGKTASDIVGAKSTVEKEYLVRLNPAQYYGIVGALVDENGSGEVEERIERLRRGIQCSGELLEAVSVDALNSDQLRITLRAGKKHHIRRMVQAVGWGVQALKRVRIGQIHLGHLPRGRWRYLKPTEKVL